MNSPVLRPSEVRQVLLVSAVLGFLLAAFGYACWQHAVEGAQVTAGIVSYPDDLSPFGVYQRQVWTLLHQIPAFFLRIGISERILSIGISGVQGMLSFGALSLGLFLLSRDRIFSCLLPFLFFYSRAYFFGLNYPVFLMGVTSTYGTLTLFLFLLSVLLVCSGFQKSGGLLLGLLPSVHPAFAAAALPAFFISFLKAHRMIGAQKSFRCFFILGIILSGLSFLFHCTVTAPGFLKQILFWFHPHESMPVFIRAWDSHRQAISWLTEGVEFPVLSLVISLLWITRFRSDLDANSRALLIFLFIFNLMALLGICFSHLPLEKVPSWLLILMPARLTSLSILSYLILVFGLLRRMRGSKAAFWAEIGIVAALFFNKKVVFVLFFAFFLLLWVRRQFGKKQTGSGNSYVWSRAVLAPLALLAVYYMSWEVLRYGIVNTGLLKDRTNDSFFAETSKGSGYLVLSPGVTGMQELTRRPVLMDPETLDLLPYAPQTAASMEAILKDIYGVELFNEKREHDAALLNSADSRGLWEKYSKTDWRRLGKKYHFKDVMVPSDWNLQLVQTAHNTDYRLYVID